eukprot:Hpha_TRINITY_DN14224_c0_g1::TRINITY_DN14224_c0_g1_i1::g.22598::m.22598
MEDSVPVVDPHSVPVVDPPRLTRPGPVVDVDVIIVGAGISGVCMAHHLTTKLPGATFSILEGRERMGGTWDLFKYPGIRSDSDMYTLSFPFRMWKTDQAIGGGEDIRRYIEDTARDGGFIDKVTFGVQIKTASWSTAEGRWTLTDSQGRTYVAKFLYSATGYYRYEAGYLPQWPSASNFKGRWVHPQHWPEGEGFPGKKVVVIGSGATAVTLVPALAKTAEHVTMLQRSPTYLAVGPGKEVAHPWLSMVLGKTIASKLLRWKHLFLHHLLYFLCTRFPNFMRKVLLKMLETDGKVPKGLIEQHFSPTYKPWEQRLCLVLDGDMFRSIEEGKASVVTDKIEEFTENGIKLQSGKHLEADVIVTATGIEMELFGGIQWTVDGASVKMPEKFTYKAIMIQDVPNMATSLGYLTLSWTLRANLTTEYVADLIKHMKKNGYTSVCPRAKGDLVRTPISPFSSGYIARAEPRLPKSSVSGPWQWGQSYYTDYLVNFGILSRFNDGILQFGTAQTGSKTSA